MPPPTDPPSARAVDVGALRRLVEGLQPGTSLWMTRADLLVLIDQRDRYAEDALGFLAAADSLSEQLAAALAATDTAVGETD